MSHLWPLYFHSKEHDNNGYLDKHITSYKYITKEINALYELYCCWDYWKALVKEKSEREAKEDIFTFVILCTLLGYYLFLQKIM